MYFIVVPRLFSRGHPALGRLLSISRRRMRVLDTASYFSRRAATPSAQLDCRVALYIMARSHSGVAQWQSRRLLNAGAGVRNPPPEPGPEAPFPEACFTGRGAGLRPVPRGTKPSSGAALFRRHVSPAEVPAFGWYLGERNPPPCSRRRETSPELGARSSGPLAPSRRGGQRSAIVP